MVSKRSSGIGTLLRHLPKAHRVLISASALLVTCSVTLFAFAIPPAFDAQPGGLFRGALFGTTNGESPTGDAQPAEDAAAMAGSTGTSTFSFSPGNIAPIGASSLGGVIAAATAAVSEEGQAVSQSPQGDASAPGNQVAPGNQATPEDQGTQPENPAVGTSPSEGELQAAASELSEDSNNAFDHYAMLSNVVSGSPIFWTYGPDIQCDVNLWNDMPWAYEIARECISEAAAYESKCSRESRKYPVYENQYNTINSAWSMISSASHILIDFLDAARACPDPGTHSGCFTGIAEGHIIGLRLEGQTVYTLKELESARQILCQS